MNYENSPFKVEKQSSFDKKIIIPTSKSHANRALIMGAIQGKGFRVNNLPDSTDVLNLITALEKIGLRFKKDGRDLVFLNGFPACESETLEDVIELHTGDGGTTNRFLIALLARGKKEYQLFPSEKMSERPISDLIDPLKILAVKIICHRDEVGAKPWVVIQGPASLYATTKLTIDCEKSTQFASAMMLSFSNLPLQFDFLNLNSSQDYIRMTSHVIKKSLENNHYTIPIDFSSLGYPAILAVLIGRVLVENCYEVDSFQADSVLIELLKEIGTNIQFSSAGLEITKGTKLKPFSFVVSSAPDLFPTLIFLAAHIEGVTEFKDLKVLDYKESSRLKEMMKVMDSFGVLYEYLEKEDKITITGNVKFSYEKVVIRPPRDHRIVMAAALFMKVNNGGELFETDCVDKSFPTFFRDLF